MKKTILALAVASSMAAQADVTTLYGSIRMGYTYSDTQVTTDTNGDYVFVDEDASKIGNQGSRFGIMGEDDLGNGLTAFYKYENRIEGGLTTNKLYLGLKGGFGSVSFGKQLLPFDALSNNSDPFNELSADLRPGVQDEADNSLVYYTPNMSGFTIGAAITADGAGGHDEHVDTYQIVAQYEANGLYAGLGYQAANVKNSADVITLGLGYSADNFSVGLVVDSYDGDETWARLGGSYSFTEMDSVYASVSMLDKAEVEQFSLGYEHKLSSRTKFWTEYTNIDGDVNMLNIGLRTDF